MTNPIPVLLERSPASLVGRKSRVNQAVSKDPGKKQFAQGLDRAVKKQDSQEVSDKGKNRKTAQVEAGTQAQEQSPENKIKDASTSGLRPETPEVEEKLPGKETEPEAAGQPSIIEVALAVAGAVQNDTKAVPAGEPLEPAASAASLDQPAEGSGPETMASVLKTASDQPQDAGSSVQADNRNSKIVENNNHSTVKPLTANEPGIDLKANHNLAENAVKTDQPEPEQAPITKTSPEPGKSVRPVAGAEANPVPINSNQPGEQSEIKTTTNVKEIMTMENHIRSGKADSGSGGEKTGQSSGQSEQGKDSSRFHWLTNQIDSTQVKVENSKVAELPPKEPVDAKDLIQQIVKKAEVMLKSDISEMKMQLKPEFLGKMLIKVTIEEGAVVTRIITENQHVKQVLEANLNSLRQNLEANGMKVEKTEVSVQLFNDGGGSFNDSDSNRYPLWSEQQGQNRHSYQENGYAAPEMQNLSESIEESANYGIGDGQINYLI